MSRVALFLAGLTLLIGFHPSHAQGQAPRLLDLRIVTVKPNRIAEWVGLQQELNEAREEAGLSARDFWQVEIGDLDTFHIFTPIARLGEGEMPLPADEAAQWAARVNDTLVSRRNMVLRIHPASIPPVEGKQYDFAVVRTRVAAKDHFADLSSWYGEKWYPFQREAGSEAMLLTQIVYAGNSRTMYSVGLVEDWDAVNAPPRLPPAESQQLRAEGGSYVELASQILLRRRHDLSPESALGAQP